MVGLPWRSVGTDSQLGKTQLGGTTALLSSLVGCCCCCGDGCWWTTSRLLLGPTKNLPLLVRVETCKCSGCCLATLMLRAHRHARTRTHSLCHLTQLLRRPCIVSWSTRSRDYSEMRWTHFASLGLGTGYYGSSIQHLYVQRIRRRVCETVSDPLSSNALTIS